ncbi:Cytochrome c oxidase subunit III [Tritonibacter multivorans]|uniref:Cbb3-type cytochrome c oxidase subunit n=1 Tax=Tritonibacter multivorans TaxID=928856 RepID=A0A0P1GAE0_9RHOB|nr:cytochrome-c oxidase, cbb3-type subunit III [Tritonibacter multivorans]MDA7422100.1 cytochrome-c oxidase, cbb3-type subunit III [Tritonibacter multivorans]CUH78469.1 Cytochrome c oxidase subunit III [Tritonibacter multivorans]SFD17337.1 cytochrome c oxidase cbb3-type subunit 3 [Tritonibacter multivorans]
MKPEIDPVSGRETTGHEWNGIKELNSPMPKAFNIWLWASIAVSVLMWVLYPSFPTVHSFLGGSLGYSSRSAVNEAVADGLRTRAEAFSVFEHEDIAELAADQTLRPQFEDQIGVLFRDNCAACHGRDAAGQKGFPNLSDNHWLWSGTPADIEYTLQVGINSSNEDTRYAEMPAFGREEMLEKTEISDVIDFVLSLTEAAHDTGAAQRGQVVFADNCASCHGEDAAGGLENGAPNLTDDTWIYGGTRSDLEKTLKQGRAGVMPAWAGRLSDAEIRQLTLYVLWQGQPDGDS